MSADVSCSSAYVWWLHDDGQRDLSALVAQLPPDEQATLATLKTIERQRHFILSRHLLRSLIATTCGIAYTAAQFHRAESGRLVLTKPEGWHISISHCHQHVAVMLAQHPCGVDIETHHSVKFQKIADRYFSEPERKYLATFEDSEKAVPFFRLWTLKEAGVKALDVGLANHLATFSFDVSGELPVQIGGETLQLWQQIRHNFFLTAAVRTTKSIAWFVFEKQDDPKLHL